MAAKSIALLLTLLLVVARGSVAAGRGLTEDSPPGPVLQEITGDVGNYAAAAAGTAAETVSDVGKTVQGQIEKTTDLAYALEGALLLGRRLLQGSNVDDVLKLVITNFVDRPLTALEQVELEALKAAKAVIPRKPPSQYDPDQSGRRLLQDLGKIGDSLTGNVQDATNALGNTLKAVGTTIPAVAEAATGVVTGVAKNIGGRRLQGDIAGGVVGTVTKTLSDTGKTVEGVIKKTKDLAAVEVDIGRRLQETGNAKPKAAVKDTDSAPGNVNSFKKLKSQQTNLVYAKLDLGRRLL